MKLVTIDFETYWSNEHTLSKMSPIAYVTHPDTEIISVAIKRPREKPLVAFGEDIEDLLGEVDWGNTLAVGHNMSEFDAMILAWRYGIRPKMWGCTLAMARPIHAKGVGGSLASLAKHYGLTEKGTMPISTKGKHLCDFTQGEIDQMEVYNAGDVITTEELFFKLYPLTTARELRLIDITTRMLVEPQFELDIDLLDQTEAEQMAAMDDMLARIGVLMRMKGAIGELPAGDPLDQIRKVLSSTPRFANVLASLGVDVPTKVSPTTGKRIPALAKTDAEFTALLESDDDIVSMVSNARLGVKSTMTLSRIARFREACVRGRIPVALRYYGADTTGRWSGTMKMNQQNLPRVSPKKPRASDVLRKCLRAPKGYKVVVSDLSGIELRVNHTLWRVASTMEMFLRDPNADLYSEAAAEKLWVSVDEVTPEQRQGEKVEQLGLGFGAGAPAFQRVAWTMFGMKIDDSAAAESVRDWRERYKPIVHGWRACDQALAHMVSGSGTVIDPWGLCTTVRHGIRTPRGFIRYPGLRRMVVNGSPTWVYGKYNTPIYGSKVDENIVQHLAGHRMCDAIEAFSRSDLGRHYPLALTVHDELVYVVRETDAEEVLETLDYYLRQPVDWWPELITWSKGSIADNYGDAK